MIMLDFLNVWSDSKWYEKLLLLLITPFVYALYIPVVIMIVILDHVKLPFKNLS